MSTHADGATAATQNLAQTAAPELQVELRFTWQNTLTTLLALIEDGNSEGRRFARREFSRMAIAADLGGDALLHLSTLRTEGRLLNSDALDLLERARLATARDAEAKVLADTQAAAATRPCGFLARQCGRELELTVCYSARGFYIGTRDDDGSPFSRESIEYWDDRDSALAHLRSGAWTQKTTP